jgi:transporter family protein
MNYWIAFSLVAFLLFGLWGFFPKLALRHISPASAMVYQVLGAAAVGLVFLSALTFRPEFHWRGSLFAVLAGVAGSLGTLCFLAALSRGRASVVVTMTALYPLVAILLSHFLLKEPITAAQGAGMVLALAAMVLLAL